MAHQNSGRCLSCINIINRYPGFYEPLKQWFVLFQETNQTFHVSCAGRNMVDQEAAVNRGASRAHFGQSAHSYGAALDLFILKNGAAIWPTAKKSAGDRLIVDKEATINLPEWMALRKALPEWTEWYGMPNSLFYELPHVQLKDWRGALLKGALKIVEDPLSSDS